MQDKKLNKGTRVPRKRVSMLRGVMLFIALLIANTAFAQSKEITILAVNDMHASIDRFPKFTALVESMRSTYPNLLLFSAGDNRTGNPVNDMHPESSFPMTALMNKIGFNLSTLGNHEFDGGIDGLRDVVNRSEFRYVCANMHTPDSMRLHVEPYKIFEVEGVRIAVLGLIQQGSNGLPDAHPDKMKNLTFRPLLQTAEQYRWLRNQCDVFILLIHEDFEESIKLAKQYPYADVIISGHSHTRVDKTELHSNALITQSESHLKYVTHITLQLTDGKIVKKESRLLDINAFPQENKDVKAMVDDFKNNETLKRVLTQAVNPFSSKEELGCLMADAIKNETGADIALQNPGGVRRETYPKGPFTVSMVYEIDPFENETMMFNLTGEEIMRLIEAAYIAENNSPPYVSGITYDMELDKQKKVKKLQVKMANGSKLDLQRTYKVVMNSYLAAISKYKKRDEGRALFRTTAEYAIEYLEKQAAVDYKGVKRANVK